MNTQLHTDALEKKYGPMQAIVLRHDQFDPMRPDMERIREVKLVDGNGTMRTFAITFLHNHPDDDSLLSIENEIRQGGMIGKTFQKYRYFTDRRHIGDFLTAIPVWMRDAFGTKEAAAVAHLTDFYTQKNIDSPAFLFGTIIEIDSPDFYPLADGRQTTTMPAEIGPWKERAIRHFGIVEA